MDMSFIPNFCFLGHLCQGLQNLSIANNSIRGLGDIVFSNIIGLKWLNMDKNTLIVNGSFVNPRVFEYLPNLEVLRLQGNTVTQPPPNATYLSNIPADTFPALKDIFLDGTETITFGLNFRSYLSLRTLDFTGQYSQCNILSLLNSTFENTPQVSHVNVASCNVSNVEAGSFEMLQNLTYLNLSHNEGLGFSSLRNVSYGLQGKRKLKVLDFSKVHKQFGLSTEQRRCDVWYLRNTKIKELYLDNSRMALIERNAFLLFPTSLEVISVEKNMLTYGPYVTQIGCLPNLNRAEINHQNFFANIVNYNKEVVIKEKNRMANGTCDVPKPSNITKYCCYLENDDTKIDDLFLKNCWPANLNTINFRGTNLPIVNPPVPNDKWFISLT